MVAEAPVCHARHGEVLELQDEVVRRTFERARNLGGYVWLSAVHGSS